MLAQRQPILELWVGFERVGAIVKEAKLFDASRDDQMVVPGAGQCGLRDTDNGLEMLLVTIQCDMPLDDACLA
jgi:hypothetical protein